MKDYFTHVSYTGQPYSLGKYMSYKDISPSYAVYLSKFSIETEPRSYEEAIKDKRWCNKARDTSIGNGTGK